MKKIILDTIKDLCTDFLYYDRSEDEDLARPDLIEAVKTGEISIEEMSAHFELCLRQSLDPYFNK